MSINLNSIIYILIFLMPGYIVESIVRMAKPQMKRDNTFTFLYIILLSAINYLPVIWSFEKLYTYFLKGQYYNIILPGFIILLFEPIAIGIIYILLMEQIDIIMKKIFGNRSNTNIPSAWDYKFYSLKVGRYVAVKLKNGDIIYGLYNKNSFASTSDNKCDLYVQQQFEVDADGQLISLDNSDGVFISGEQIVSVEFYMGGDKK